MKLVLCKGLLILILSIMVIFSLHGEDEETSQQSCTKSSCHKKIREGKWIHSPVSENLCDACHEVKEPIENITKDHKSTLTGKVNELCLSCHSDFASELEKMPTIHKIVSQNCTKCHNPHGSDFKFNLKKESPSLCFECHAKIEENISREKHTPIKEGECLTCHDPHASNFKKLLVTENNSLCKTCHDPMPE